MNQSENYSSSKGEDSVYIETKSWENYVTFSDINKKKVEIPYSQIKDFSEKLKESVNGEEIVTMNLKNIGSVQIPKSKVDKIEKCLLKAEGEGKNIPASKQLI
jgi:hypothetical protein